MKKKRLNQRLKKQEVITYEEAFEWEEAVDYSSTFSCFEDLFSLTYIQPRPIGTMDVYTLMQELLNIFQNHRDKVDSLE